MAEKDLTEKILEDYPDVFADIVNGLLFDGRGSHQNGRAGGHEASLGLPGGGKTP